MGLGNNDGPGAIHYLLGGGNSGVGRLIARRECMEAGNEGNQASTGWTRSAHSGGAYVCMADGSVHFVSEYVDYGQHPAYWVGYPHPPHPKSQGEPGTWERMNMSVDGLKFNWANAER